MLFASLSTLALLVGASTSASTPRQSDASPENPTPIESLEIEGRIVLGGEAPNGEEPLVVLKSFDVPAGHTRAAASAFDDWPEDMFEVVASTRPDDEGRFAFEFPEDADLVRITAEGRYLRSQPLSLSRREDERHLFEDIRLGVSVGAHVTIRYVSDAGDTSALEGREVVFQSHRHEDVAATIGEGGVVELRGLGPGLWRHAATQGWYVDGRLRRRSRTNSLAPFALTEFPLLTARSGEDMAVECRLERAIRFRGRVLDALGSPMPRTRVEFEAYRRTPIGWDRTYGIEWANGAGEFELFVPDAPVEIGGLIFHKADEAFMLLGTDRAYELIGKDGPVEVTMPAEEDPSRRFDCVVRDESGAVVKGLTLDLRFDAERSDSPYAPYVGGSTTDASGRATLRYMAAEPVIVHATRYEVRQPDSSIQQLDQLPRGFAGEVLDRRYVRARLPASVFGRKEPVEVELRRCGRLRGRVKPPSRADGDAVHVRVYERLRNGAMGWTMAPVDAETGEFDIPRPPGTYLIAVGGPAVTDQPVLVEHTAGDLTIDLDWEPMAIADLMIVDTEDRTHELWPRVFDERGDRVDLCRMSVAAREYGIPFDKGRQLAAAPFLAGRSAGTYRVLASTRTDAIDQRIEIPGLGGEDYAKPLLEMSPGARVVFRAPDEAALAPFRFRATHRSDGVTWGARDLVDGRGPGVLVGAMPPGAYTVTVRRGDARVFQSDVTLGAGDEVEFDADRFGEYATTYSGTIASSSMPLGGLYVSLSDAAGSAGRSLIDTSGRFEITTTATGTVSLELHEYDEWGPEGVNFSYTGPAIETRPSLVAEFPLTLDPDRAELGPIVLPGGSIEVALKPDLLWKLHEGATPVALRLEGGAALERPARPGLRTLVPLLSAGRYEVFLQDAHGERIEAIAPVTVDVGPDEDVSGVTLTLAPR